jgi:hypothetical protein
MLRHAVSEATWICALEASARFGVALAKIDAGNGQFVAAVTTAKPERAASVTTNILDREQATKPLICEINVGGHGDLSERLHCQVAAGAETSAAAHYSAGRQ